MSERSSDEADWRKVISDRRKGVVRSLIFEFEHLAVDDKSENVGMPKMGVEQSTLAKGHPMNSKNLVRQRVSQFDQKQDDENHSNKKKRHQSTTEHNNQFNPAKDFQRSKSLDYGRKEKDRYSRSRQVSPRIKEDTTKFETSTRAPTPSNDPNNNNVQKKGSKKKTNQETTAKNDKIDKTASIKTNPKLSSRFDIIESCPVVLKRKEKVYNDSFKIIKKDSSVKETKSETVPRVFPKRAIRSVKSIKKVFESNGQPHDVVDHKTLIINKSNCDTAPTTIDDDDHSRLNSNKRQESDMELSEHLSDSIKLSENLATCTEGRSTDNNKEDSYTNQENSLHFEHSSLNGVAEEFDAETNDEIDFTRNYSEDERKQIKNSQREVEQAIRAIKELGSQTDLFSKSEEETKLEGTYKARKQREEKTEHNRTGDQEVNKTRGRLIEAEGVEKSASEELENTEEELEEPENIKVYVRNHLEDELEDEFGQRSFGSFENINFTEAYNRVGDELIVTSVAAIERRSLSESSTSKELLLDFENKIPQDRLSPSPKDSISDSSENDLLEDTHSISDETNNALENKLYFNAEELRQEYESDNQSNRSRFYSSTNTNSTESMERYSKAESDGGVETEKNNALIYEEIWLENNVEIRSSPSGGYDRTIKTETIYDSFQNPRIAKVSNVNSEECVSKAETPLVEESEHLDVLRSPSGLKPKKDYIIEELIDTEKKYIKHLEKVVWEYMPVLSDEKLPPSLIGKSHYLFGNIRKIYSTTQRFYKALRMCGNDHEEIAKTFLNFKHLFELYPLYSKNKPLADQYLQGDFKEVVAARQKQLNDRLGLASNLLTPIQRLGKYILFLEQLQKELVKRQGFASDNIYKAIETVRKQMSRGNDYIAIDSIKECPISLQEQGSFLMREKFNVIKPRKYEAMLFLFEEILVFTTVDPRNPENFIYRDSIKLNEMGIVTFDDQAQPLVFHLKRFPSYKKGPKEHHEFVIEAKKNKDKKTWTEQIEKRLWEQLVKCKEEQRELHSNQGKRTSVVELPDRTRKKKAGYSSLPSEMRKNSAKSIFYTK